MQTRGRDETIRDDYAECAWSLGRYGSRQQVGMAVGLAALVGGYRLSYLVAAATVACALAGVLLLLPATRTPK